MCEDFKTASFQLEDAPACNARPAKQASGFGYPYNSLVYVSSRDYLSGRNTLVTTGVAISPHHVLTSNVHVGRWAPTVIYNSKPQSSGVSQTTYSVQGLNFYRTPTDPYDPNVGMNICVLRIPDNQPIPRDHYYDFLDVELNILPAKRSSGPAHGLADIVFGPYGQPADVYTSGNGIGDVQLFPQSIVATTSVKIGAPLRSPPGTVVQSHALGMPLWITQPGRADDPSYWKLAGLVVTELGSTAGFCQVQASCFSFTGPDGVIARLVAEPFNAPPPPP